MGLLGDGWEDPKSMATMQLAAGLLGGGNFGQALGRGLSGYATTMKDARDQKLEDLKMDMLKQQVAQATRKESIINSMLSGLTATGGAGPTASGGVAAPSSGGGSAGNSSGFIGNLSPEKLAALKLAGVGDLTEIYKLTRPDMQVSNGYAYDKNSLMPGFLPGVQTSQDGKSTLTVVDPKTKLPLVVPTPGAVETYGQFEGVKNRSAAQYDPITVTPQSGPPVLTNRLTALTGGQGKPSGYAGGSPEAAAIGQREILMQERAKAVDQGRAEDVSAIDRELSRLPGAQTLPGIALQSEAEKAKALKLAEGAAGRENADTEKQSQFTVFKRQLEKAGTLLGQNPTASGIGANVDSALNFFGVTTPSANTAAALDTTAKWLTQNVPKAPGAQSDYELKQYSEAAGMVGDRTKPVEQRLAALKTAQSMIQVWEDRAKNGQSAPQATSQPQTFSLPPNASQYAGRRIKAPDGSILRSDGKRWVKE